LPCCVYREKERERERVREKEKERYIDNVKDKLKSIIK